MIDFFSELIDSLKTTIEQGNFKTIIKKIEAYEKPLEQWESEDLDNFLTSLNSSSQKSLQKIQNVIKTLHKFACDKTNTEYKELVRSKKIADYMNYDKLRSTTLTYEDYKFLRDELEIYYDGMMRNLRDKVMLELAWETLTVDEIKNLKEKDIEFIDEKAKLKLSERNVWIDDPVTVKDLKLILNEKEYYRIQKNNKVVVFPYKYSDYVIKALAIREDTPNVQINNLSSVFKHLMKKSAFDISRKSKDYDGTEHVLEIERLSLDDVKRSKIIYLLGHKYTTIGMVIHMLGKGKKDYGWLNIIAKQIYGHQ